MPQYETNLCLKILDFCAGKRTISVKGWYLSTSNKTPVIISTTATITIKYYGNKNSLISEGVYHQSHSLGVRCGLSEHSFILHHKIIGFGDTKF